MGYKGKASSGEDGFIGVNVGATETYVNEICGQAIKDAIKAAKETRALFDVFEDGWEGQSVANFESNFATAVSALEKSLSKAYSALAKQIAAITDAMVDQDIGMVEKQG